MQAIADELLDELEEPPEVDLVEAYCSQLPVTVITEILGVRPEDRDRVLGFGRDGAPSLDVGLTWKQFRERRRPPCAASRTWLGGHLERLRREPGSDLLSQLVTLEDEGQRLDDTELRAVAGLVLAAGFETTVNLLGSGTVLLLEHPDQLARLRDDPTLWPNAVDEVLRYEAPVQVTARFALRETELAGRAVPPGRPRRDDARRRQPRPGGVRRPGPLRRRPARTPATTCPSPAAGTSAWAPRWPGSRARSACARCSSASPTCELAPGRAARRPGCCAAGRRCRCATTGCLVS